MAALAWFAEEERQAEPGTVPRAPRRRLLLAAGAPGAAERVIIHDLSATGLLIESDPPLAPGETIDLDLPHAGACRAHVVWQSGGFSGCQFTRPLSRGTLAAATLAAAPPLPNAPPAPAPARLATPAAPEFAPPAANDARLPVGQRVLVIFGLSMTLWAGLFATALSLLG